MQVRVLLSTTLFPCLLVHSKEKIYFYIYTSEREHLDLDDGTPSDAHAHVHCLRSEQCTCACNLNNKSLLDGDACVFDQVLDQTINS